VTGTDPTDRPPVRIGDAERAEAAERLSAHAAAGRLTFEELEQRLERVYGAVHARELAAVEADLPGRAPRRAPRPRRPAGAVAVAALLAAVLATVLTGHPVVPLFVAPVLLWRAAHRPAFPTTQRSLP